MSKLGPKSSIKATVAKSAKTDGTAKGLKSNTGKFKSAIEGEEKSEAILRTIFENNIQHAEERAFHSTGLADQQRYWSRRAQQDAVAQLIAGQKANAGYSGAGALAAGVSAIGGIAALAANNKQEDNNKENSQTKQGENHAKHTQKGSEEQISNSETQAWENQSFEVTDANSPENVFGQEV